MPASVALLACLILICMALLIEARQSPELSFGLWVPVVWVFMLASRPLAQWFYPTVGAMGTDPTEGNAFDRNLLIALMAVAFVILIRRNFRWGEWIRANPWIAVLFVYLGLSAIWSDFTDVSLKRWFRSIGSLLMVLVILSERHPVLAAAVTIRRCALVLVPLSIVLIKYFRTFAVAYNPWTGEEYLVGVTTDKNGLGRLCLVAAFFSIWTLVSRRHLPEARIATSRVGTLVSLFILAMSVWLLNASKSSTSMACFLVGGGALLLLGTSAVHKCKNHLGSLTLLAGLLAGLLMLTGLPELVVTGLGRNMTFTDRTYIWADLLDADTNPVFGVGYASFWLGSRLEYFLRVHQVNEAHSGYLDVFVELGYIGLFVFLGVLISGFFAAKRSLSQQPAYGRLRLSMLLIFLIYNFSESAYKATTLIGFMLLLVVVTVPSQRRAPERRVARRTATQSP